MFQESDVTPSNSVNPRAFQCLKLSEYSEKIKHPKRKLKIRKGSVEFTKPDSPKNCYGDSPPLVRTKFLF